MIYYISNTEILDAINAGCSTVPAIAESLNIPYASDQYRRLQNLIARLRDRSEIYNDGIYGWKVHPHANFKERVIKHGSSKPMHFEYELDESHESPIKVIITQKQLEDMMLKVYDKDLPYITCHINQVVE